MLNRIIVKIVTQGLPSFFLGYSFEYVHDKELLLLGLNSGVPLWRDGHF